MTRSCQPSCCQPPKRIFLGVSVHHSDQSEEVWCQQVFRETETLRKATLNLRRLQDSGFQGRVCAGAGGVTSPVRSLGTGTVPGQRHLGRSIVLRVAERRVLEKEKCWAPALTGAALDHPLRRLFQRKHISFRRVTGTSSASDAGGVLL